MAKITIDQALQQGVEAHKAGQVQEADRLYTAILKAQPKHPDANHNMGVLAVGVGKIDQALPFFKTALEANPATAKFWLSYIDTLIKLERITDAQAMLNQAKSKGGKGDGFDKLGQRLREAAQVSGDAENPPKDQLQTLISFYNQGQLEQALEQAVMLLHRSPSSSFLHNICGAIYKGLGQLDASIGAYNKALALNPYYAEAYNNLGVTLKDLDKLEEAIKAYKKAISIKPVYAEANYNMGSALQKQGKLEETIEAYNKAIEINPEYAGAYYNMGIALQEQGKQEEAIKAYNKTLAIKPDYAEAYNNMGNALQEQGKQEEAIEAYTTALAIRPDYAEAYNNMGVTLTKLGKLEEALKAYKKALAIKPNYADAQHIVSALTGKTTSSAPRQYIENLFDGYSKKFEQSLVKNLEYKVPKLLTKILIKEHGGGSLGSVLDLGCGTGLTGLEIKDFCSSLEGIDLSKKMLELAKAKNVYDKLVHTDILDYLTNMELCFDYFIATDVLIYVGDLTELFRLIKSRNKQRGKWAFSTEESNKEGFNLETSGRYSHSKNYIEYLCKKFDYSISFYSEVDLRKEKGTFLTGGLYLLNF
jgi:predicted TPR repeat methyltransferase